MQANQEVQSTLAQALRERTLLQAEFRYDIGGGSGGVNAQRPVT